MTGGAVNIGQGIVRSLRPPLISVLGPGGIRKLLIVLAFVVVAGYRLYLCYQPPITSTDLLRYIGFGWEFWRYGLTIYNYPARAFGDTPYALLWPDLPFIYPAVCLLFFALLAKVWPALFFGKLILTAMEGVNAFLVWKISHDRWLALLYFANPVSLWWVSREGQYEPLVNLFVLLAIYLLPRRSTWAYLSLALAIQAKYTPVFLLPYFLKQKRGPREAITFVVGFLPSLAFALRSQYIFHILVSSHMAHSCNTYTWNLFDQSRLCGSPDWLVWANALLTYGLLALCLAFMVRRRQVTPYLGLALFVVFLKSVSWAQFWYLLLVPALAMTVDDVWERRLLFLLSFSDSAALHSLFLRPFGWVNPSPPLEFMWKI